MHFFPLEHKFYMFISSASDDSIRITGKTRIGGLPTLLIKTSSPDIPNLHPQRKKHYTILLLYQLCLTIRGNG